jgi:hypothetical protein
MIHSLLSISSELFGDFPFFQQHYILGWTILLLLIAIPALYFFVFMEVRLALFSLHKSDLANNHWCLCFLCFFLCILFRIRPARTYLPVFLICGMPSLASLTWRRTVPMSSFAKPMRRSAVYRLLFLCFYLIPVPSFPFFALVRRLFSHSYFTPRCYFLNRPQGSSHVDGP